MVGAGVGVGPAEGQTMEESQEYPPSGHVASEPIADSANAQLGLVPVSAMHVEESSPPSLVMVQQSPTASWSPQQHSAAVPTGPTTDPTTVDGTAVAVERRSRAVESFIA